MSPAVERVCYMSIGAFMFCCVLIVLPIAHVTWWRPDIVIPEKILTLAGTAFNLMSGLCLAIVINILSKQSQVTAPSSKP